MNDLITAIGLLLFLEGLVFAIFPSSIKNMVKFIESASENKLRIFGVFFLIIGFAISRYVKN